MTEGRWSSEYNKVKKKRERKRNSGRAGGRESNRGALARRLKKKRRVEQGGRKGKEERERKREVREKRERYTSHHNCSLILYFFPLCLLIPAPCPSCCSHPKAKRAEFPPFPKTENEGWGCREGDGRKVMGVKKIAENVGELQRREILQGNERLYFRNISEGSSTYWVLGECTWEGRE